MIFFKGNTTPTTRPLLPTDEDKLNMKLAKNHINPEIPNDEQHRDMTSLGLKHLNKDLSMAQRSSSNRNMEDLLQAKSKYSQQKALTDTNNFIENFNRSETAHKKNANHSSPLKQDYSLEELREGNDNNNSNNDDQISLGSVDNTMDNAELSQPIPKDHHGDTKTDKELAPDGLSMDKTSQKRYDEWAERGAAKIVQEVTNPKTGETYKKLVKKGIKDFKFGDMIGDGAYSTVMLATSIDTGKKYAVKVLNKAYLIKQKKVKYVNIEKNALQRVNNSRSIIKLFFTFQDEASLYFLLEYAPNGDFLSLMKKFGSLNETATCYYSAQIIDAIDYLHIHGIIHRDIKPENILLDQDWKVKLTDFGTAKLLDSESEPKRYDLLTRSKSFVGTAEYVSPELLNDSFVDYRCDIWAFGCILFQMIAGKPPFKATNEYLTFQKVMKVQYAFTAGFPTIVRDLVKRILVKQMSHRLTIAEIERHPFYKDKNFRDGSIWNDPVPELSGYKINAKSMLPIPDLKDIYPNKRSGSGHAKRSVSAATVTTATHSANNSTVSQSPTIPRSHSSYAIATKDDKGSNNGEKIEYVVNKPADIRTTAILDNARKTVKNRRASSKGKHPTSGAALAASLAFGKNSSSSIDETNSTNGSGSTVSHPSNDDTHKRNSRPNTHSHRRTHPHPPQMQRSSSKPPSKDPPSLPPDISNNQTDKVIVDPEVSTPLIKTTHSNSESDRDENGPTISKHNSNDVDDADTSISTIDSSIPSEEIVKAARANVNKLDVPWSFYLKDMNEHIIRVSEVNISVIETPALEKTLQKFGRHTIDPQNFNSNSRSTLLSQVARSGGEITGLRTGFRVPEDKYYGTHNIDFENVVDVYRSVGSDLQSLLVADSQNLSRQSTNTSEKEENVTETDNSKMEDTSPHQTNSTQNENDSGHSLLGGRMKKLFSHTRQIPAIHSGSSNSDHERFMRRILVITNYGRALTFVGRKTPDGNGQMHSLSYGMDLCQMGLVVKEIPLNIPSNNLIVLQTPYKSFIMRTLDSSATEKKAIFNSMWLTTLKKCIKSGTEHKKHSNLKHITSSPKRSHTTSGSPTSSLRKTDTPGRSPSIKQSPHHKQITSPLLGRHDASKSQKGSPVIGTPGNESKHSLLSKTVDSTNRSRKSRIFNSYVSAREKEARKANQTGVPTSSKLVNGLPVSPHTTILGFGLSSSKEKISTPTEHSSNLSKINLRHK